jgi:pseudouridylate synthase
MPSRSPFLRLAPEVADALDKGRAVVALESTIITHGLPWPDNLAAARRSEEAVRRSGAVPATIALHEGSIRIGLGEGDLEALASARDAVKVSRQDLAAALGGGGWAGTTVSATMIAAHRAGIGVFATGGIGGVHRGGQESLDISADLDELSRTPVAVVCAGPKSILDVGRTLEVLETRGVPVVGWGTRTLAGFYSRDSGHEAPLSVAGPTEAAALIARQRALELGSGVLFAVPLPDDVALPRDEVERAVERALDEADAAGIHGPRSTPWVLARLAELTDGRTVRANLSLIEQDAEVAGAIAVALSALTSDGDTASRPTPP